MISKEVGGTEDPCLISEKEVGDAEDPSVISR